MGNEKPQQLLDGMALLTLSPMPETLKLTGAASAEIAGRLLEVSAGGVAIPGHPLRFKVKVFNPLSSDRTFRLALEKFPKSFRPLAPSHEVQVPAGKTAEVEFELEVGNDFKANYGSSESLLVAYTLDGTPWKGNLVVPVNAAVAVPAGDNFNRKPDFVLNDLQPGRLDHRGGSGAEPSRLARCERPQRENFPRRSERQLPPPRRCDG